MQVQDNRELLFGALTGFEAGWFQRGRLVVLSGAARGLTGAIKRDRFSEEGRRIELWHPLGAVLAAGDLVRLEAGCDKRFETCRLKFNNVVNYQGFPDIPEEDWMLVHPTRAKAKGGGSRR